MKFETTSQEYRSHAHEGDFPDAASACVYHFSRFGVWPDQVEDADGNVEDVRICEGCGLPVLAEHESIDYADGIVTHAVCPTEVG